MPNVFLFPGQGAQTPGMGSSVAEAYPEVAGPIFNLADEVLGFSLSRICFDGPDEVLSQTEITQPALLTTSVAILAVLRIKGLGPDLAAGHSVGEYAALVAAGAVQFEDALPVVRLRGELMAEAVKETPGAMAAIVGLDSGTVQSICAQASAAGVVEPSNLNAPSQIVISGQVERVLEAMEEAKRRGAKAIRLNVSAPFHCSLMRPVRDRLRPAIESMPVRAASVPVIANATAESVREPEEIRQALLDQIESPVRWTETMTYLRGEGPNSYFEVGPGKVLSGLFRSFDRSSQVTGVSTPDEIEKAVAQ